jgi:hypothetical protein
MMSESTRKRVITSGLLVIAFVCVLFVVPLNFFGSIMRYRAAGILITFWLVFWGFYWTERSLQNSNSFASITGKPFLSIIEKKALLFLIAFVCIVLIWIGFVIFRNPFLYEYNQGNGAYFAQVAHNICMGVGPEESIKANGSFFYQSNPYFYTSAFAVTPQLLGYALIAPIYCLYPYPPMHVFASVFYIVFFGSIGMYFTIQAMGGEKAFALLGAAAYSLLPWVELPMLFQGNFDLLGFAVYPYAFACLFSRRWKLLYIFSFLLAMINIPYSYSVMAFGIMVLLFFRAPIHGVIVILIGVLVWQWDMAVVRESLRGVVLSEPLKIMNIVLDQDFSAFRDSLLYHSSYLVLLLMTVSFFPIWGLYRGKKWNRQLLGLLFFAAVGIGMGLFRSYGWTFHRNANMVVPIYLGGFLSCLTISREHEACMEVQKSQGKRLKIRLFLFSGIVSMLLWFSWHFPWAGLRSLFDKGPVTTISGTSEFALIKRLPHDGKFRHVLSKMNEFIPPEASVAYRVDAGLEAFAANRHKAWQIGYHPDGVEYFLIQTSAIDHIVNDYPEWQQHLKKIESSKNFRLLYKDDILVIYKNLDPSPVPRLEQILGWKILLRANLLDRLLQ